MTEYLLFRWLLFGYVTEKFQWIRLKRFWSWNIFIISRPLHQTNAAHDTSNFQRNQIDLSFEYLRSHTAPFLPVETSKREQFSWYHTEKCTESAGKQHVSHTHDSTPTMFENLKRRLEVCLHRKGPHFKHVLQTSFYSVKMVKVIYWCFKVLGLLYISGYFFLLPPTSL